MTWLRLAWANLIGSPLTSTVNALLLALGTSSIVLLLLAGVQFSNTMSRDAEGIDLVLGAKGSPVQLILSSVYHADVPTGNISMAEAERWANDPRISRAIPLSLGDSFQNFRIVGTTHDYLELYRAEVAEGRRWEASMEAVVGAAVAREAGLSLGSTFAGVHGLDGGHAHDEDLYEVVGILSPTRTVADRLVLTSLESVWSIHGIGGHDHDHEDHGDHDDEGHSDHDHEDHADHDHEDHADHDHSDHDHEDHADHDHGDHDHEDHADHDHSDHDHEDHEHADHDEQYEDESLEVTAMLLTYGTPLAAVSLPREINTMSAFQAASPAVEITRLVQLVGVGIDGLRAFGWVLVVTAGLSLFAALYGSLRARRFELAMLRCLGATRLELFFGLALEGLLLTLAGVALGVLGGHVVMEILGQWLEQARGVVITGWIWVPAEATLVVVLLGVGALASAIPAWQAYHQDVSRTLSEG